MTANVRRPWRRVFTDPKWQFFTALAEAAPTLTIWWWLVLVSRGVVPVLIVIATGTLVGAVQSGGRLTVPLAVLGLAFVVLQVLTPIHEGISAALGDRLSAWLYERLMNGCVEPAGLGHLEDPALADDLVVSRDFDTGMLGPPLFFSMPFIASGLVEMLAGLTAAAVLFAYAWWAPVLLGGTWLATHWLLRDSAVWHDHNSDEVRTAQRHSDYTYRLAVDPPAAKELRLFGLAAWTVERFVTHRRRLHVLQFSATRLRTWPMVWTLLIVVSANVVFFWTLADATASGRIGLGQTVIFAQAAVGTALIAFGGFNWAMDRAAAPVAASRRLGPAMAPAGALADPPSGTARSADGMPTAGIRFRDVTFRYTSCGAPVLDRFDLTVPAGSSVAIVGQNGAGKTTLAKLLCRMYDPHAGGIEVDGVDLRDVDVASWRRQLTAVFQDFIRLELSLRENVAPAGAPDDVIRAALAEAGATEVAGLDVPLAKGYPGGTDLSGGQWQRVALARVLCAVHLGAGVVILDEPTAQLDVRGEAEIFSRILRATRHCTTLLVSHRFSTVRQADRICVMEHGRVAELGTHVELMSFDSRYRRMFNLQARRFDAETDEEGMAYDALD